MARACNDANFIAAAPVTHAAGVRALCTARLLAWHSGAPGSLTNILIIQLVRQANSLRLVLD